MKLLFSFEQVPQKEIEVFTAAHTSSHGNGTVKHFIDLPCMDEDDQYQQVRLQLETKSDAQILMQILTCMILEWN